MTSTPTSPTASPNETEPRDALTRYFDDLGANIRAIEVLAERACVLFVADRILARRRLRLTVAASMAVAALLAMLAGAALGLPGAGILVTGVLAGVGAGAPGLLLLVHPALLDRALTIIARSRR